MRFYTGQYRYYCGIDVHARTMYLCILDQDTGKVLLHRNLRRASPSSSFEPSSPIVTPWACSEDLTGSLPAHGQPG